MDTSAPIDFEKGLIAPMDFCWKQELRGNLYPSIEIPNIWLEILNPAIEIPNDTPENAYNGLCFL